MRNAPQPVTDMIKQGRNRLHSIGAISLALAVLVGCERKPTTVSNPTPPAAPTTPTVASKPAATATVAPTPAQPSVPVAVQRGPKLRHPEKGLVSTPEAPDPARDRLRREFAGVGPNDPRFFETLRRLWSEIDWRGLERPVSSTTDNKVASGKLLPRELHALLNSDAQRTAEKDSTRMLGWLAGWSGVQGGNHLPSLMEERVNQLPPTDADLAIYSAVIRGIEEMNPSTNRPYLELWKPLTEAKNPIYRLLALEASVRAISADARGISTEDNRFNEVDASAKVVFVQPFLAEEDPLILGRAVRVMGTLASPAARTALERFRAAQQQAGNAELVTAADEALRSCESLLATLKPVR